MVGQEVIDELELDEPVLGTDLIVGNSSFTIIGIMERQGEMFGQSQDDFLDAFAPPEVLGKIGTDIEDAKCSRLVCKALEMVMMLDC